MAVAHIPALKLPHVEELLALLHTWAKPLMVDPDFRAFNRAKLRAALDFDEDEPLPNTVGPKGFPMSPALSAQHDAGIRFYYLNGAYERLRQTELYFRAYPFRHGEASKADHLQNVCGMYFASFYVLEERLAKFLGAVDAITPLKIDIGRLRRMYKKAFKAELDERHCATHSAPFDDISLDRLWMASVMAVSPERGAAYRREETPLYRRETARWAKLARARSRDVALYVEAAAKATLEVADFLRGPAPI